LVPIIVSVVILFLCQYDHLNFPKLSGISLAGRFELIATLNYRSRENFRIALKKTD